MRIALTDMLKVW